MKKGIYILAGILFLLGSTSILVGLDVINLISSAHRMRYVVGGAFVDLLAISLSILVSVNNPKAALLNLFNYFRIGIFEETESGSSRPLFVALFLGLMGMAALALILWITPYGAGVNGDSVTYINSAKNVIAGNGYSMNGLPETHFPPLYSLFLVVANLFANNFVLSARILNACLFGLNTALIALLVYLTTGRKLFMALCAAVFFLASGRLLEMHAWAFSEPLFITFSLAGILFLYLHAKKQKWVFLIAASLLLGCAFVTRYIGMAFLPAILAIVFFSGSEQKFGQKLRNTFIALLLTCAPLAVFLIRNRVVAGAATDRNFFYHPLTALHYGTDLREIAINFFAPIQVQAWITLSIWGLIAAFLIAQIIILFKRGSTSINWRSMDVSMPFICLAFSICYLVFLYVSISFMDASTPVDARILSPLLCILIVGVFSTIWTLSKTLKAPLLWGAFLIYIVFSIVLKTPDAVKAAAVIQENGLQYTSRQWRSSETIAFINSLPENVKIFSNGPDVISFLADRNSASIPNQVSPVTKAPNGLYNQQMDAMCKLVEDKGAFLVYFNEINWRGYLPNKNEIASICKLPIYKSLGDGIVYGSLSK